jgi:hypothetical protein
MIKKIFADTKQLFKKREEFFAELLASGDIKDSKGYILFILLMNTYYVFIPAFMVIMNIIIFLAFMVFAGIGYYFAQEAFIIYKEHKGDPEMDDRYFYTVAYCFALANVPAMLYLLLVNLFAFAFSKYEVIAIFVAMVLSLPALFLALYPPLKLMKFISGSDYNIQLFADLIVSSFIKACNEWLGFKALQEMWVDYQSASK